MATTLVYGNPEKLEKWCIESGLAESRCGEKYVRAVPLTFEENPAQRVLARRGWHRQRGKRQKAILVERVLAEGCGLMTEAGSMKLRARSAAAAVRYWREIPGLNV